MKFDPAKYCGIRKVSWDEMAHALYHHRYGEEPKYDRITPRQVEVVVRHLFPHLYVETKPTPFDEPWWSREAATDASKESCTAMDRAFIQRMVAIITDKPTVK